MGDSCLHADNAFIMDNGSSFSAHYEWTVVIIIIIIIIIIINANLMMLDT